VGVGDDFSYLGVGDGLLYLGVGDGFSYLGVGDGYGFFVLSEYFLGLYSFLVYAGDFSGAVVVVVSVLLVQEAMSPAANMTVME
jgi:hypothetical protein